MCIPCIAVDHLLGQYTDDMMLQYLYSFFSFLLSGALRLRLFVTSENKVQTTSTKHYHILLDQYIKDTRG